MSGISLEDGDYVMKGDTLWITAQNISVEIRKTCEGVLARMYPVGFENEPEMAQTFLLFSEAEEVHDEDGND